MKRRLALALLALACCTGAKPASPACRLGPADRAWLDRSVQAWQVTRAQVLRAAAPAGVEAMIFDARCVLRSQAALAGRPPAWRATSITGDAIEAGGNLIPVGVVSGAMGDVRGQLFVMSTPSVWAHGGVAPGSLGLSRLMTAVMMHEATHLLQMPTYGAQVAALQAEQHLSDEAFNDDAIQKQFEGDPAFKASVERETELFFAASAAPSKARAIALARQARALMRARQVRFFVGQNAYQTRAEDLWLTLEGSGQWAGYQWLLLPARGGGAGVGRASALAGFGQRSKWWTQREGLAIVLTVERLSVPGWKARLFRDGGETVLQLLDRGLTS